MARYEFHSKLRGVQQEPFCRNITRLHRGDVLIAVREASNGYDKNAIRVDVRVGILFKRQLPVGYLSADIAQQFAPLLDRKFHLAIEVAQLTGIEHNNPGVNIRLSCDERRMQKLRKKLKL